MRVGAVAGAHQRHRDPTVGEQRIVAFGLHRVGLALLQGVGSGQQVAEQWIQRQEVGQIALVRRAGAGLGDVRLGLAGEQLLAIDGFGQRLRDHFGAHRRPVGVGTQEHLAAGLGLLQRRQQVGGEHIGLARLGVELVEQLVVQAGRRLLADVFGIEAGLGRDDRQHQLHALALQCVTHSTHQCQVVLYLLLRAGGGLELLVGEQPLVAAQHHAGAAFVEQFEVQRGPQVGANALDRELLVVVGLGGLGQLAVEQGHLPCAVETFQPADRPCAQPDQQAHERQRIGDAKCPVHDSGLRTGSTGTVSSSAPRA